MADSTIGLYRDDLLISRVYLSSKESVSTKVGVRVSVLSRELQELLRMRSLPSAMRMHYCVHIIAELRRGKGKKRWATN